MDAVSSARVSTDATSSHAKPSTKEYDLSRRSNRKVKRKSNGGEEDCDMDIEKENVGDPITTNKSCCPMGLFNDKITSLQVKGRFTRICVDLDLDKPLQPKVIARGYLINLQYEGRASCDLFQMWEIWSQGVAVWCRSIAKRREAEFRGHRRHRNSAATTRGGFQYWGDLRCSTISPTESANDGI